MKILDGLAAYAWCGYGALVGKRRPFPFESVSEALALFASDANEARQRWLTWMAETLGGDGTRESASEELTPDSPTAPAQRDLVSAPSSSGHLDSAPPAIHDLCRRLGVPLQALRGNRRERRLVDARSVIAYFAVVRLGMPGVRVAAMLGISGPSVSQALGRGRRILEEGRCALRV